MKIKYLLPIMIASSLIFLGCKKSFLETTPTQFATPESLANAAVQDPKLLNGSIAGLYSSMYNAGVGGTNAHEDFGQKGIDIYTDMIASDMVLGATIYGWYTPVVRYQATTDFTLNADYIPWRYYYRQILGANSVIDALGGTDFVPTTTAAKSTMGQAKAMRAYGYFYLSQLYAKEYGTGSEKVLPIYTSSKQPAQPKSTTKAVWDLMAKDLTESITLLGGFNRASKDQIDQNVAKGLLCYVLGARGSMADWTQVVTLTNEIKAAYPFTTVAAEVAVLSGNIVTNPTSGFNNAATPSWMWGVDLTIAQGVNLISWWGQVDQFTYSYCWAGDNKPIDRGLYDAIRSDDIRKGQFAAPTATYKLQPINKFFDPARISGGQRTVTTDLVYMRADEFYLLNAEANANIGQDAAARTALSAYLAPRIADVSYLNTLAGQTLKNEIYLQTRIELWGEGKSYLAMKRNKGTITRGSNHLFDAGSSFQYNDPKLTFVIPQAEVLNNPVLNN